MAAMKMFLGVWFFAVICFLSWFPTPSVCVLSCPSKTPNCTDADLCPKNCACVKPPENMTDCSNRNLTHLPELSQLNGFTRFLMLGQNHIDTLWRIYLPYLREYIIPSNALTNIKDDAFADIGNLTLLNLSRNSLTEISGKALNALGSLITLDLSHNLITTLATRNFDGTKMKKLTMLDLSNNAIVKIGRDAFYQLKTLKELKLSHNRLKSVSHAMFQGTPSLIKLSLEYNGIKHIGDRTFQPMADLTTLVLHHNDLSDMTRLTFYGLDNLRYLCVGHNMLGHVPSESLRELIGLKTLVLDGNQMVKIKKDDFPVNLKRLETLSISNMPILNHINDNAFDDFENLKNVNISGNLELTTLGHQLFFRSFHVLRKVDISRNSLEEVDESLLPWNNLFSLDVAGNKWRCDCHVLWMKQFTFHKDIRCYSPKAVAGKMYGELSDGQFICNHTFPSHITIDDSHRDAVRNGLAATALTISVLLIGFLVYRFRRHIHIPCQKKPGNYNTLYNIYDPTKENSNNVVIKYRGDEERLDSRTTGVDMDNEMKAIL